MSVTWMFALLWVQGPGQEISKIPLSGLERALDLYTTDRRAIMRFYPMNGSQSRHEALAKHYQRWSDYLGKFDFQSLSQDGRVDYLLFRNHLDYSLSGGRSRRVPSGPRAWGPRRG